MGFIPSNTSGIFVPIRWYNNESGVDIEVALKSPDGGFAWVLRIPKAGSSEWNVDSHAENPTGYVITPPHLLEVGTSLVFRKSGGNAFAQLYIPHNWEQGFEPVAVGFGADGTMLVTKSYD